MRIWISCIVLFAAAPAPAKKPACDGIVSNTKPSWCIKPPAGYQLTPVSEPGTQVFLDKASNSAFDVSWYPQAGGVDGRLERMRKDVPAEGGKEIKEEPVPGGKLFRYLAPNGATILMVLAAAGPGPKPDSVRVVTCRVNLAESNAEFAKQAAACKTLRVMP